jgi:hypothetical protein
LGEEITMAAPYKPGPQARFLVDKMAELEKSIQEVLTRLAPYLDAIECMVDGTLADFRKVQEKVDLAMKSVSLV